MTSVLPKITNRLKELRERGRDNGGLWLTQKEVAKIKGCHHSHISRQEKGETPMDEADIIFYASLYKVNNYELFMRPAARAT